MLIEVEEPGRGVMPKGLEEFEPGSTDREDPSFGDRLVVLARGRRVCVMPPPTPYSARCVSVSITTVRIATLKFARGLAEPGGARYPIAPQYTPRGAASSSAMMRIVETFGAPVTDPLGNRARSTSTNVVPGRSCEPMLDVRCQTVS